MYTIFGRSGLAASLLALASALPLAGRAQGVDACWSTAYAAIRHEAEGPHPASIVYDVRGSLRIGDDSQTIRSTITYHDDGTALVDDDRFAFPYRTQQLDPGPPELGPYAGRRANWLTPILESDSMKTIGSVHSAHHSLCSEDHVVTADGRSVVQLRFGGADEAIGLRSLWIDPNNNDIVKVALRTPVQTSESTDTPATPAEFQIELAHVGPFQVVRHVTWQYRDRSYSQSFDVYGEYYYSDFRFPSN